MLHVILVDDDPILGNLLCEMLREAGHEAACYTSPAAARLREADVIVTDCFGGSYTQPEDTDRAYLRDLAAQAPTILLTGRTWAQQLKAADLGVAAILPKPADLDDLVRTVEQVAHRERQTP